MLVTSATNAISALKWLTTCVHLTMIETKLNHLMLLHVHRELAYVIDMLEVANLFVGHHQQCKQLFGKFSENDVLMKSLFASKATQTVK